MDNTPDGRFSGHIQSRFGSSVPLRVSLPAILSLSNNNNGHILQAPHSERRGDTLWENRPTSQPQGQGSGTHSITPQATVVNQGLSFGPSFPPAPYTNPVDSTGGFLHGTHQGGLSNTSPPQHQPGNHHHHHPHTQSSPVLINGHHSFNHGRSYNMEASRAPPPDLTQATHQASEGPMAEVSSIRRPARALSPQAGSSHILQSLPCPVSRCQSSLGRTQEQKRHLLTHLPHWIHCPAPECFWRGDRPNAFGRHWSTRHPSGIRVPCEDEYRTYDPQPLVRAISEGTLDIQDAQGHAISMVRRRASELRNPELSDDPWGSKCKRLKNSDLRHIVPTS